MSVRPVFDEIAATLLPGISNVALRALISDEIETLLREAAPKDISILVSEQDEASVAALLNATRALSDVSLQARATLSDGQAYISCGAKQNKIDVKQAIHDIQTTIDTFLDHPIQERANAS